MTEKVDRTVFFELQNCSFQEINQSGFKEVGF